MVYATQRLRNACAGCATSNELGELERPNLASHQASTNLPRS